MNIEYVSILVSKIGVVLIIVFVILMILRAIYIKFTGKTVKTNSSGLPLPPCLQFFGRSKSETIAINAFATVLYERGIDWTQIKAGYRHECLKNPSTGRLLELDAYASEIKVAIEYNGIQHYKYPNPFHKDLASYEDGLKRDILKRELCKSHGITLIEIPYHVDTCIPFGNEWKYKKTSNEEKWNSLKSFIEKAF